MPPAALLAFIVILAFVSIIDIRERRIPNQATAAAAAIALVAIVLDDPARIPVAVLVAMVIASPSLLACLVNPAGMGMGDVKLMGVIGLYLGWAAVPALLAGLLLATVTGAVIGLAGRHRMGEMTLPLAPFLTVAAVYPLAKLLQFPLH